MILYHRLTLIRAAGGVYDFRNFEEVYFCNGLSSELKISCIPRKTSHEYILLSTYERKTAFSAIYRPKHAQNRRFFTVFGYFVLLWRYIWLLWISPLPPPVVTRQAVLEPPAQSLALSKCRPGASRLRQRHDILPPSLLLAAWRSYMNSSRTTMSIYIAARIRVNPFLPIQLF